MSNFVVSNMFADVLAPLGVGMSTGSLMTSDSFYQHGLTLNPNMDR